jgi:hypothetical protein
MLYIDKTIFDKTQAFRFDPSWDCMDLAGIAGTHEKSLNWNDTGDGIWEALSAKDDNR